MKQIYINNEEFEINIALVEDGRLINYWSQRNIYAKAGNIYKGKIIKVIKNLNFIFIDIGDEKPGFLSLKTNSEVLDDDSITIVKDENIKFNQVIFEKGQDILVQVLRAPYKTKGARLSTNISLPGYYTVFLPYFKQIGISKKIIDEKERRRLREILLKIQKKLKNNSGIIARTTAAGIDEKQLEEEIRQNHKKWKDILKSYKSMKAPSLLYEEEKFYIKILRDILNNSINEIIIDSKEVYNDVKKYINKNKLNIKLKLYDAPEHIFKYYNLLNQIDGLKNSIIPIKKGGYLKIDVTEALTVIDVNSGKFKGENNLESSILMLNLNAAKEIARQIILRNIGGLIVVDFIDMQSEENKRILEKEIEKELLKSKVYFKISKINEFGLLVISRKRTVNKEEETFFEECPHCGGRGIVPTKESICIEQLKKLKYLCRTEKNREIILKLESEIKQEIQKNFIQYIKDYEKKYKKKIILQ